MSRHLLKTTFLILLLVLVQCGKSSDSEKVDLVFADNSPTVIPSDFSIVVSYDETGAPVTETITGPWFKFNYSITNGTTKELIIQSLLVKVTGTSDSGEEVTSTVTLSVDDLSSNKDSNQANDKLFLEDVPANTVLQPSQQSGGFYIGGLPTPTVSTVFNVEIEAIGWFGSVNAPLEKFSKKFYLTTE